MCPPVAIISYLEDDQDRIDTDSVLHIFQSDQVLYRTPKNEEEFFAAIDEWTGNRQYLYIAAHGFDDGVGRNGARAELITWDTMYDRLPPVSLTIFGICISEMIARRCFYKYNQNEDTRSSYLGTPASPLQGQCRTMARLFFETLWWPDGRMRYITHEELAEQLNAALAAGDSYSHVQFTLFE